MFPAQELILIVVFGAVDELYAIHFYDNLT